MLETLEIPNKSLFKLNEVCGLTGVKPYVLRFWESEFEEIEPITSSTGQKLYEPKDIEAIATIKKLLFDEKMKIEQVKAVLADRLALPTIPNEEDCDGEAESKTMTASPEMVQVQRMGLTESDLDKLMMAKNLLREIVSPQVAS